MGSWLIAPLVACVIAWDSACKHSANLYDIYHCCVYSAKLLMMDRETLRNK